MIDGEIKRLENCLGFCKSSFYRYEILKKLGTAYSNKENYEKSLEYRTKALEVIRKINERNEARFDSELIYCLNVMGRNYYYLEKYKAALPYYEEAQEKGEKLSAPHIERAQTFNGLGKVCPYSERYKEALKFHEKAKEMVEKVYKKDKGAYSKSLFVIFLSDLGDMYSTYERMNESLECYKKAAEVALYVYRKFSDNKMNERLKLLLEKIREIFCSLENLESFNYIEKEYIKDPKIFELEKRFSGPLKRRHSF
jgi:tetratricopeptide (TPR) repeat protein